MKKIVTTESVTEAHPDKLADRISDAVLDFIIERDKEARVACETIISNGFCVVAGEVKTSVYAPISEIARETIKEAGYTNAEFGFDYRSAGVLTAIGEQSKDVAIGVDREGKICAGDSGFVYGYACDETKELMPYPIMTAHKLAKALTMARKSSTIPFLYPDGKIQLGVEYKNEEIIGIDNIIIHAQHSPTTDLKILKEMVIEEVIAPNVDKNFLKNTDYFINPTGIFVTGGPGADTGLTGRKSVSDAYGGYIPHGGSAFSGKDPTKPDRSGSYLARMIAKNLVGGKVCKRVQIGLTYMIGTDKPISFSINTFGTSKFSDEEIIRGIKEIFPLTISQTIQELDLLQPIYKDLCAYGHFGKENFPWEELRYCKKIEEFFNL